MRSRSSALILPVAVGALFSPLLEGAPVADFELEDLNATSPRYGQAISPRDYRHQVSAYYFGDPT